MTTKSCSVVRQGDTGPFDTGGSLQLGTLVSTSFLVASWTPFGGRGGPIVRFAL